MCTQPKEIFISLAMVWSLYVSYRTGYGRLIGLDFDSKCGHPWENPTMSFRVMQVKELWCEAEFDSKVPCNFYYGTAGFC